MPGPMFQLDFDERQLSTGFVNIKRATSEAVKNTLNVQAALTRKNYLRRVDDELILRNTFTRRQIRFEKTEARVISRMESRAGATEAADYMELQEKGGLRKPKRGSNLAIPQLAARGGALSRLVNRQYYLRRAAKRTVKGGFSRARTQKAKTVARAAVAKRRSLLFRQSKNIYAVTSFTRRRNGGVRFRTRHIYNISETRTRVRGKAMLEPAAQAAGRDGQNIFDSQVRKLIRQRKII